jgi:two-component system, chemotaxis family, chemotaxis protein CheY
MPLHLAAIALSDQPRLPSDIGALITRMATMTFDQSTPVLVVDGRDAEIRIVRALLQHLGYSDVDEAANVTEALTKMRAKRYALIICDWHVEPMTGCEFVREARGDVRFARIPFILTGEPRSENVVAAKRAGASSYIVKPFNAEMLKAKIEAAFGTRTAPLPDRQQAAAAARPQQGESGAKPASADDQQKFDGLFTTSI